MNKRQALLKAVKFFNEQKKVMTLEEYRSFGTNVPVKDALLRAYFGNWARLANAANKYVDEDVEKAPNMISSLAYRTPEKEMAESKVTVK